MTTPVARLREAAAFIAHFASSDWASCHVLADGMEIFVARDGGSANPLVVGGDVPEQAPVPTTEISAPHIGTLVALAEVGTTLAAGEAYARIAILDETIDLVTENGGAVAQWFAQVGALVEYEQPLLSLS